MGLVEFPTSRTSLRAFCPLLAAAEKPLGRGNQGACQREMILLQESIS